MSPGRPARTVPTPVGDWMTPRPLAVRADEPALGAFDLMVEHGVRHLPVVDEAQRVVGILSIDDLRAAFPVDVSLRRPLGPVERYEMLDVAVADAMTWAPQTARPEEPLAEAARALAEARIGCLPVVDEDERLVGILSETDALRALVAALRGEAASAAPPRAEAEGLVDALWAERQRLVRQLGRWQDAERELSTDIGAEPRDSADAAIDERDVARLEPISARASRRLRAIEVAIARAEQGRFGICERCGARINPLRLRVLPEATLCVRCAREEASGAGAGE